VQCRQHCAVSRDIQDVHASLSVSIGGYVSDYAGGVGAFQVESISNGGRTVAGKTSKDVQPTLAARGTVLAELSSSARAARRALAGAMVELGRADDPHAAFLDRKDVILTALLLLGRSDEAKRLADRHEVELPPVITE
jgi:hypothetical protein